MAKMSRNSSNDKNTTVKSKQESKRQATTKRLIKDNKVKLNKQSLLQMYKQLMQLEQNVTASVQVLPGILKETHKLA
jgi:hypothetical protein